MAPSGTAEKITVIGAGYVGLPTAAVLAHFGHDVTLAEANPDRHDLLLRGRSPIVEKGLEDLLRSGMASGKLRIRRSAAEATVEADFVFLCVPTPQGEDGSADLTFVEAVSREISASLKPGAIIVNKSTVPVGTVALVERVVKRADVKVVSNPEFLREGTAVSDSLEPDRIVVGADDPGAAQRVGELFAATGAPLIVTTTTTSETIKYASNAFLATKLSFVNAIAALCEAVGADVRDLILGLGYDKRIGFEFLRPGPGWGGSCLPKDTSALVHMAESAGYDFALLRGAIAQNEEQLHRVVHKITEAAGGSLQNTKVAVWGLTFKANTDDRRSSPALHVATRLLDAGATVVAYDPTVTSAKSDSELARMTIVADPYEASRDARVVALLTEWDEFRWLDFEKVADLMESANLVDARNLLDPRGLRNKGFTYFGIGRP